MTRIAALNDWSVGSSEEEDVGPTREALEAQATKSYNEAITHLAHHNLEKAYENFCLVLQNPYIEKACWPEGVNPGGTLPQDVALRYSCLKNLGNLAAKQGDHEQAAKHYLEAVQLDNTEVTVWQRLGATAIKLKDFELALIAFQEGLNINPKHWPCLDQLLSILFILEMYMDCLGLIIMALKRDPCYTKANAFKDKIFVLQPSLLKDVKCFFRDSDILFHTVSYNHSQGDKFIQTCETLRPPCKTPKPTSPFQPQQLRKPLPKLTWNDLAQALIQTYDVLIDADGLAFAARIDIHEALKIKDEECTEVGKNVDNNEVNSITPEENQQQESKNANTEINEHCETDSEHKDSCKEVINGQDKENGINSKMSKSPDSDGGINASNVELSDNSLTPKRIPSRRQTIELGESQDSFRVSEKRRSVDSDTFSHPEDDLRGEEEGLNVEGKAALSNGFNATTLGVEKIVDNCESKMKDSEKTATQTKDSIEAGELAVSAYPLQKDNSQTVINSTKENDEAKNLDQSSCERKLSEPDIFDTEDDPDNKSHKVMEPHDKKSCSVDNQGRSSEKLVTDTGKMDNCKKSTKGDEVEDGGKVDVVYGSLETKINTEKQENLDKGSSQIASKEGHGESVTSQSDIIKVRKDDESSQQSASNRKNVVHDKGVCGDGSAPKEKEKSCTSPQDTETEANVSHEISDQEEGLANDMEEDKQNDDQEVILGEVEQDLECGDGELRDEEDEEGLEEEEEEEVEEGEEGLLSSEATETEEAVNTLKGIMALQPTEILGLPEPDFDYENEYVEYFDGGVYEEDEMYQEENEMEDGEVMEPVEEEMEQVEEIDGVEQGEEMDQECDAEQMEEENEVDEQEEIRDGNIEQGQERDVDKTEGEPNEENRVQMSGIEHEEATGEGRIEEDRENFEEGEERSETGRGEGLERDDEETDLERERGVESHEGSNQEVAQEKGRQEEQQPGRESNQREITGEVKDKHCEERIRVEEREYREEVDAEDQDDVTPKASQKDNQNEDEGEEQNLREKRNSTEDDIVQAETDTDAEGSKTDKANTDEKNDKSSENKQNIQGQNGQGDGNTSAEVSNKSEEPQAVNKVVRKPKRHKRGLERELEQLDYWGRRQERDAKRRRRTISSKLLGTIEEAEYLTWGDLLRSFVPTSLINCNAEEKGKSDEKSNTSLPSSKTSCEVLVSSTVQHQLDVNSLKVGEELKRKEREAASIFKSVAPHPTETDKSISNLTTKVNLEVNTSNKDNTKSERQGKELMDEEQKREKDTEKSQEKCENGNIKQENEIVNGKEVTDGDSIWTTIKEKEQLILSPLTTEEKQVEAFLLRYEENGGILDLLQPFLTILWKRQGSKVWPISAANIFTEVYPRVRNHVMHEEPLNLGDDPTRLYQDSMLTLTHWELVISLYHNAKSGVSSSQLGSIDNPFSRECPHLEEDLLHLNLMLGRGDVWVAEAPQFHTRVRWLQAQVRLGQDKPEQAVACLHLLLCDLERLAEPGTEYVVEGVHVEGEQTVVSNSEVRRNLNFLQRSHMLEQVVDNYTDGRYHVVAELLTTIFHEPPPKSRPGVTLPTRQTQLAILIDSLFKLKDYKGVISWGAHGLEEALMRFNRAEAEEEKNRWAKTLMKISDTMNTTLKHHITCVEMVSRERLVHLVTTLISMLVIQLEKSLNANVLPFETLSPWILLHRMLAHEEKLQKQAEKEIRQDGEEKKSDKSEATSEKVPEDTDPETMTTETCDGNEKIVASEKEVQAESKGPIVPHPSTLFLITAHDELGKHSWCNFDDGVLLLYCLDILVEEVQRGLDTQYHQLLVHTLEQVSFCLYSQPSRKSKHKHLRDHGVQQIGLCWERALQLYNFYCPPQLPDFQSSQIPSITDDVAALYKRIFAQFPHEVQPEDNLPSVEAYIKGEKEECNFSPVIPFNDVIRDCFYLLGDYYFKNKEWNNAIKYYKLDLTINLDRLESWAPVGLAMKAILETQLNSCEVIQDEAEFFSMAQAATRCFSQALKLDEYHTNLWVEFGGLVYMVHSHASRLLKQDLNPDISLDTFELLEKLKGEMLTQAEVCFTKALTIQEEGWDDESLPDERWLHCYMLGKVAEKQAKPPETILQYYIKASEHLHQIQAKYPSKINYNSPQEYSVEALEMYYRGHAYILKYLQLREGKSVEQEIIKSFTRILDKFAAGPFARCQEWKYNSDRNASDVPGNMDSNIYGDDDPSLKRQRDEQEGETEPVAKKVLIDGISYGLRDTMKDIVIEMVYKAVTLSCEMKAKECEEGKCKDGSVVSSNDITSEKDKRESDDEIQVVEEKVIERNIHISMIGRCVGALKMCLSRFPQHYKAIYRLAHYYNFSKFCKDSSRSRNYLLGCDFWQRVGYMPVNGLFFERKVWIQQPRNCNFFHGVWRIPNDEVDRPGSFAAHMYRCVSLTLDVLPQMKDFYTVLQIALALKNSPEKDKKYLRDNERELLSEHATQVGLQTMKDKYKVLFKDSSPIHGSRCMTYLLDVFRSYKQISKHLPGSEPHLAKMLTDSYASYRGVIQENRANILREADAFCTRNQHLQHRVAPVASTGTSQLGQPSQPSSMDEMTGVSRRGRPPGAGRGRGRGRGAVFTPRNVSNHKIIQEAYKLYENLYRLQCLLSSKTLDQATTYTTQKELEFCQAELLKYLRYPSVAQYFHNSLQGMGTNKLPPPNESTPPSSTQAQVLSTSTGGAQGQSGQQSGISQQRPTLSALAARSQAHGISITSVPSSKASNVTNSIPVKPSMSVTVSPVKTSCPSVLHGRGEISVISMSRSTASNKTTPTTTTTLTRPTVSKVNDASSTSGSSTALTTKPSASSPKTVSSQPSTSNAPSAPSSPSVPKLPAGTTLTRPRESPGKSTGPRPQLQAQVRPAKTQNEDSALDGLSSPLRKTAAEIMSSTSLSNSRPGSVSSSGNGTPSGQNNKPSLPKGMTITPAPRIKSKALISPNKAPSPSASSSSSYMGAYKAPLGLGGTQTGAGRGSSSSVSATVVGGESRGTTSAVGKPITQLSTTQLMQLAYGKGSSSGNISGLISQISKKQPTLGDQSRPQPRHPGPMSQRFPAPGLSRPLPNFGQRGTQLRPCMQVRPSQVRQFSPGKSLQNKPAQSKSGSSDDIITLD
ncbi:hypothetical protein Pmani_013818 [Petrolisthes manimaculis]|uniref:Calcineurin-binding protein cabin-1 n=1 Tax=Petrolisthes manimaculis TaxID=1843537 RepID=A0AAE1PWK0_9EUCA|nr:hypothetical protein Pmani_013818 [Petrolisthes manimaculis]